MTSRSSTERHGDFSSESVVSHLVSWVSSWVVLFVFWFCWFVVFCVCVVLKTPSFLLSPILQHEGIANQRQNVLMTVRASSAHGMSSKKSDHLERLSLCPPQFHPEFFFVWMLHGSTKGRCPGGRPSVS